MDSGWVISANDTRTKEVLLVNFRAHDDDNLYSNVSPSSNNATFRADVNRHPDQRPASS